VEDMTTITRRIRVGILLRRWLSDRMENLTNRYFLVPGIKGTKLLINSGFFLSLQICSAPIVVINVLSLQNIALKWFFSHYWLEIRCYLDSSSTPI
jgi:hypothetical protein